jgi:hypothetical protein
MMDHERTEKELQEVFEEIQRSYKASIDNAIALQERTLELARELIGNSTGQEFESAQATLEDLASQSRGQREHFEKLARKATEAYMRVLTAPSDYHHKVEEAKSDLKEASPY